MEPYSLDSAKQILYLVKYLLDSPCFRVWVLSPIQSRVIKLTKDSYVNFFETEFQSIVRTDVNDVLRVLSNIPYNNDVNKQTLLFAVFEYRKVLSRVPQTNDKYVQTLFSGSFSFEYIREGSAVSDQVRDVYKRKQCDVVMLCCDGFGPLCNKSSNWLGRQHFIQDDFFNFDQFNPYLHQILMDLMNNPQYNWRQRYTQYRSRCQPNRQENVFFWEVFDPTVRSPNLLYGMMWEYIENLLPNATFYLVSVPRHDPRSIQYSLIPRRFSQTDHQIRYRPNKNNTNPEINILMYKKEIKLLSNREMNGNKIHIIFDDTILESPLLEDNKIKIWLEDFKSPLLIKMLMERIDSFRC